MPARATAGTTGTAVLSRVDNAVRVYSALLSRPPHPSQVARSSEHDQDREERLHHGEVRKVVNWKVMKLAM
jgi:hypothetical protein